MDSFHVRLYCGNLPHAPLVKVGVGESDVQGWQPSKLSDHDWRSGQFATTFEATLASYEAFDRMFIELDGSFVWRGDGWQIDGHLYDRSDRLY